jgi:hypothetical protein
MELGQSSNSALTSAGASGGHGDSAHGALAHEFEDVGLGEVTAEGFAGGADGYRGLGLGFAFAGGEHFDGAAVFSGIRRAVRP